MLYLLRHGQSIVNIERRIKCRRLDGDLTTLGYNQAHKAGLWLKEKRIRYIVTSPVMRAQQTAEIIGKVLNLRPQVDDRLREMDCGDLEDRTDDGAWDIWHRIYNNWLNGIPDAQFPNGESY
ncbi:MAG: histidine phosphatase family protein, partial [Chloroflexota bacterium]